MQNDDAKYIFPAFICSLWLERQRTSKPVAFNGIPTVVLPEKTGLRNPRARFREADGDSWLQMNTDFLRAGANPVDNPVSLASIPAQYMRWCDNEDFKGLAVDLLSPLARLIPKPASKWYIMVRQRLENQ